MTQIYKTYSTFPTRDRPRNAFYLRAPEARKETTGTRREIRPQDKTQMASYSNSEMELLLTTPVDRILAYFGRNTAHRSYMYFSPFRDEASPSMRVTVDRSTGQWYWADFGGTPAPGKKADGGGCLEMVRRLSGVSTEGEALDILAEINGTVIPMAEFQSSPVREKPSGIVVESFGEAFDRASLVRYAERERGIPLPLLERYCRQVTYHPKSAPSRRFTVIGFPNNGGGFALRGTAPNSKYTTLCDITTLTPDGMLSPAAEAATARCYVFEGFMDFLSWLAWRGEERPGADVCVLNSVSNLHLASGWLLAHGVIRCFLDNDRAGKDAYESICEMCPGRDIKDGSTAYRGHKDLNEAYVEWRKRQLGLRR